MSDKPWTEELLGKLLAFGDLAAYGLGVNHHLCVKLEASMHELEWESSFFRHNVSFTGLLATPPGNELAAIRVAVKFVTDLNTEHGNVSMPENTICGTMYLSAWINELGEILPALSVCLLGDISRRKTVERLIQTAKMFGDNYVPLWLWGKVGGIDPRISTGQLINGIPFLLIERAELKQIHSLDGSVQNDAIFNIG